MRKLMACLVALVATTAANAVPITFVGSATSLSSLGDELGTPFDQINVSSFGPTVFNIPYNVPTTVSLSPFDFVVGINATVGGTYNLSLTVPFTVNGVAGSLTQPFNLVISGVDTLTFGTGSPVFFLTPSGDLVRVTLLGQDPITSGVGTVSGTLRAEVLVVQTPEPISIAVFGTLLVGGAGVALRRRMAKATA